MDETTPPTTAALSNQLSAIRTRYAEQLHQAEEIQDLFIAAQQKLLATEDELAGLVRQQMTHVQPSKSLVAPQQETTPGLCLILNPAAKNFVDNVYSIDQVVLALRSVGLMPQLKLTTPEIGARQLALNAVEQGNHLIIAAGGDGTIEEIATALIHTPATLGILPLGTMNNLARGLGIPLGLEDAARLLAIGLTRRIDVGRVITPDNSFKGYFLETAGIGISAVAAPIGEDAEKGRWADAFSKLGEFFAFTSVELKIQYDDEAMPHEAKTHLVTISNAPLFGNNMLIAPEAKCDDGLFDVAIYDGMELIDLTRYFFGISKGGRVNEPRVQVRRAQRVRITGNAPLAINADLDILEQRYTWEIEIVARALSVVVGPGMALMLPATATSITPLPVIQQLPTPTNSA
ncbi:MAG: diacylglycerol kinase family protein [Caldilineaceae bacterium]